MIRMSGLWWGGVFMTLCMSVAVPVHTTPYGGVDAVTATSRFDDRESESIFIHTAPPGSVIEDGVIVVNDSSEEKIIVVSAVDVEISRDGELSCAEEARDAVGSWVTVQGGVVTVPAYENKFVPFSVTVPDRAEPGEHAGCIVIEDQGVGSSYGTGVALKTRVTIRISLTVPGEVVRELRNPQLWVTDRSGGGYIAHLSVQNSGTVSITTDAGIDVRSFPFSPLLSHLRDQSSVVRGSTKEWEIDVDSSAWGGLSVITARFAYRAAERGAYPANVVWLETPPTYRFSMPEPWAFAIEVSVLVSLILLFLVIHDRRRRARRAAKMALVRKKVRQVQAVRAKRQRRRV